MADASFDIVSKIDMAELNNAISQAMGEIKTRFDFKGSKSEISVENDHLVIFSDDDIKIKQVIDVLISKMAKRGIGLRSFDFEKKPDTATGQAVRLKLPIKTELEKDQVKQIVKLVKDSKLKVTVTGQGDSVRVSGKSRDDLQEIQRLVREADFKFDCQFTNYK